MRSHARLSLVLPALVLGLGARAGTAAADSRVLVVGDDAPTVAAITAAFASHKDITLVTVPAPPIVDQDTMKALAVANELNAIVTVRVSVAGSTWTALVVAFDGRDRLEIDRYEVKSPVAKLASATAAPLWKKLGAGLGRAQPPMAGADITTPPTGTDLTPPSGPDPTPPTGPKVADVGPGPSAPSGPGPGPDIVRPVAPRATGRGMLRVSAAVQPVHRRLRFTDDVRDATRPQDLTLPAVGVDARIRPVAGQPIEITGAFELSVGGSGATDDSAMKYDARATEWSLGAGYGLALGANIVNARVAYGQQTFRMDDDAQPGPEQIPDVDYRWIRAGVDTVLAPAARWNVEAGFGWRFLLDTGDLYNPAWFPRGTGNGFDGELGVRFALKPRLDLFARAEVRHYYFSANPELGDPLIVGGAIDTFIGGAVGASLSAF